MPQGFGFEARRGDRRSGDERRALERRLQDRRDRVVPVLLERRLSSDRRNDDRRLVAHGPERRNRSERRSQSYRGARGLRLTQEIRREDLNL